MNGYTQLVKQWEKDFNKKKTIEKQETEQNRQRIEKAITTAVCENLISEIHVREKEKELVKIKDSILLSLRRKNPFSYNQYLIIWDILHNNFIQIISDLNRERIQKSDIKIVFDYVKGFSLDLIPEYWELQITA